MTKKAATLGASATEMVTDGLRKAILGGEYAAGAKLSQDGLANRFGTSRIPVREALRHLAAEGLVSIHSNRGATVTTLSLRDVLEIMDIRIALECCAIRFAIPNVVESDIAEASSVLSHYDEEERPEGWSEINWRFHKALYAPCDRPRLLALIEANFSYVDRLSRMRISMRSGKELPLKEHYLIFEAWRDGDVDRAERILREHLRATQKMLMAAGRLT